MEIAMGLSKEKDKFAHFVQANYWDNANNMAHTYIILDRSIFE